MHGITSVVKRDTAGLVCLIWSFLSPGCFVLSFMWSEIDKTLHQLLLIYKCAYIRRQNTPPKGYIHRKMLQMTQLALN